MKPIINRSIGVGLCALAIALAINGVAVIVSVFTPVTVKAVPDTKLVKELNASAYRVGYLIGLTDGINRDKLTANIKATYRLRMAQYDEIMKGDTHELCESIERSLPLSER